MRTPRAVSSCALAIALAVPHASSAQAVPEGLIPRDLVEALLSSNFASISVLSGVTGTRPIITVGQLAPEAVEDLYLPASARILGAASTGAGSVSYYLTSLRGDSLMAEYSREMPKRGWTSAPRPDTYRPTWGFVDPPRGADTTVTGLVWCKPGRGVFIAVEPGATERRVSIMAGSIGTLVCQQGQQRNAIRSMFDRYPLLYHPVAAERCAQYSSSSSGLDGSIVTSMSPDSLLAHYRRQLVDSGWTVVDVPTASKRFIRPLGPNRDLIIEVGVRAPAYIPGCLEVYMNRWERER